MWVWEYDVIIKFGGYFVVDKDYGDIDVMVYDILCDIFYLIECKNINLVKNIKEMKIEMDEYFGCGDNFERDKKRVFVFKYLCCYCWVMEYINEVVKYIGVVVIFWVKLMMLIVIVILIFYFKREKILMLILNYFELKIKGVNLLDLCKELDLSVFDIWDF